jgi:hypothetical protein
MRAVVECEVLRNDRAAGGGVEDSWVHGPIRDPPLAVWAAIRGTAPSVDRRCPRMSWLQLDSAAERDEFPAL